MPLDMNPEIRAQWCAALRSGEYDQAQESLKDGDGYCCLGVLCEIARAQEVIDLWYDEEDGYWKYGSGLDAKHDRLPDAVANWAGLRDDNPHILALLDGESLEPTDLIALNDEANFPFAEIADLIDGGTS